MRPRVLVSRPYPRRVPELEEEMAAPRSGVEPLTIKPRSSQSFLETNAKLSEQSYKTNAEVPRVHSLSAPSCSQRIHQA